jgi:hypothetical protein
MRGSSACYWGDACNSEMDNVKKNLEPVPSSFPPRCGLCSPPRFSDAIIEQAMKQGMKPVIPPRKNRTRQRPYDKYLYKLRHLVKNAFLHLKR